MSDNSVITLTVCDWREPERWTWLLTDERQEPIGTHVVDLRGSGVESQVVLQRDDDGAAIDFYDFIEERLDPLSPHTSETQQLDRVGRWIAKHVLGSLAPVIAAHAPVTVSVVVPVPAGILLSCPLELAVVDGVALALRGATFVFVRDDERSGSRRETREPLRILAMFSLPIDAAALTLREERRRLKDVIERARRAGAAVDLRILQYGVTTDTVSRALAAPPGWDIVHFSGHGAPGMIIVEGRDGGPRRLPLEELMGFVARARPERLKLVTLSSCESAADASRPFEPGAGGRGIARGSRSGPAWAEPQTSSVHDLVRDHGCAVLAMRYPVADEAAALLVPTMIENLLLERRTLPRSLWATLTTLTRTTPPAVSLTLATPTLLGRSAALLRFDPPCAEASVDTPPRTASGLPPEAERFVGRIAQILDATRLLGGPGHPVVLSGPPGIGKTSLALELAHGLGGLFQSCLWCTAPDCNVAAPATAADIRSLVESVLPLNVTGESGPASPAATRTISGDDARGVLVVLDDIDVRIATSSDDGAAAWRRLISDLAAEPRVRLLLAARTPELPCDATPIPIHALPLDDMRLLVERLPRVAGMLFRKRAGPGDPNLGALVAAALDLVEGHPGLLVALDEELQDVAGLADRVSASRMPFGVGSPRTLPFLAAAPEGSASRRLLEATSAWTAEMVARLPEPALTFFFVVCLLEPNDRKLPVVRDICEHLDGEVRSVREERVLDDALEVLERHALLRAWSDQGEAGRLRDELWIDPVVAELARSQADSALAAAVEWTAAERLFTSGIAYVERGNELQATVAMREALPYLYRTKAWGRVATSIEIRIPNDGVLNLRESADLLDHVRSLAELADEDRRLAEGVLAVVIAKLGGDDAAARLMRLADESLRVGRPHTAGAALENLGILHSQHGRQLEASGALAEGRRLLVEDGADLAECMSIDALDLQTRLFLGHPCTDLMPEAERLGATAAATSAPAMRPKRRQALRVCCQVAAHCDEWSKAATFGDQLMALCDGGEVPPTELVKCTLVAARPLGRAGRTREAVARLRWCRDQATQWRDVDLIIQVFITFGDIYSDAGPRYANDAMQSYAQALGALYEQKRPNVYLLAASHFNLACTQIETKAPARLIGAHLVAAYILSADRHAPGVPDGVESAFSGRPDLHAWLMDTLTTIESVTSSVDAYPAFRLGMVLDTMGMTPRHRVATIEQLRARVATT